MAGNDDRNDGETSPSHTDTLFFLLAAHKCPRALRYYLSTIKYENKMSAVCTLTVAYEMDGMCKESPTTELRTKSENYP